MNRDRAPTLRPQDDRKEPGPSEKAFMALSAAAALALLGFLLWQAATTPADGEPVARVVSVEPSGEPGEAWVVVEVENPSRAGLLVVEVEVACGEAPHPSVTFENVPAKARERARVRCLANAAPPEARVVHYVGA